MFRPMGRGPFQDIVQYIETWAVGVPTLLSGRAVS